MAISVSLGGITPLRTPRKGDSPVSRHLQAGAAFTENLIQSLGQGQRDAQSAPTSQFAWIGDGGGGQIGKILALLLVQPVGQVVIGIH